jgi:hypothetical protein
VNPRETPVLDARDAAEAVTELTALQPAFTPEIATSGRGAAGALAQIFGKYVQAVIERLNQAPDKNKLAFLDLMGINLLPAQAARAPLVFTPIPLTGNSRAPARTRAGAKLQGSPNPLVFETEQDIALAAAPLAEVVGVIPAHDSFASHSTALARGESVVLFQPEHPVVHQFYLGHRIILALTGESIVKVQFDLSTSGNRALDIAWEYWNGKRWQGFDTSDATAGLTRSGTVRLTSISGTAELVNVNGENSYWIRGSLRGPLPPDPSQTLPLADKVRIACDITKRIRYDVIRTVQTPKGKVKELGVVGDLQPDQAYSEGAKLDVTKSFFPLGKSPDRNSALYFSSVEVFSKPGAQVTLAFRKVLTPEEQADELAAAQAAEDAAQKIIKVVTELTTIALGCAQSMALIVEAVQDNPVNILAALAKLTNLLKSLKTTPDLPAVVKAIVELKDAMVQHDSDWDLNWDYFHNTIVKLAHDAGPLMTAFQAVWDLKTIIPANQHFITEAARIAAGILTKLGVDMIDYSDQLFGDGFDDIANALVAYSPQAAALSDGKSMGALNSPAATLIGALENVNAPLNTKVEALYLAVIDAITLVNKAVDALNALAQTPGAGTVNTTAPVLDPPMLVWEYYSTNGWRAVLGPADDQPLNFLRSGEVQFAVPKDFASTTIQGVDGLWMRVRLDSGSYQTMRILRWQDPTSQTLNTVPILEQRPPALEGFYFGYHFVSPLSDAQHVVTLNDFQFVDETRGAAGPGLGFTPYHPVSDVTPTLYLGFDGPLPADSLGLYFALPEPQSEPAPVPVKWECFDGEQWSEITVQDETAGLVMPGIVHVVWPGVPAPPLATVSHADGTKAVVIDPRQAAQFKPGQQLYISQNGAGELVHLASIVHDTLTLAAPLSRSYSNASIQVSVMPRFGAPRSWIRVRLQQPAEPLHPRVSGIFSNAVWASQMQTNQNETLGGSTGEPNQSFFLRQTPVLNDEVIQIRELDGPRAGIELPLLREDLARNGKSEDDLRIVNDPRSGQITEVWVRWQVKDNLLFSGPDARDLTLERTTGRLIFGDGVHGRIPPAGSGNILAAEYRSGGGLVGNVPKGSISQLLSGVTAQSVTNPRRAEAGADGETIAQMLQRGPFVTRYRYQGVARLDYEEMAQQASPGGAVARAYPATHPNGRPAPGWVTLVIIPQSADPQPQPTFGLRQLVHDFIAARAPASLEGLAVIGPTYLPVGVNAKISLLDPSNAGPVGASVRAALTAFLHPLTGGPEGQGWPFGRSVYLSDVASLSESIPGVDFASSIELLLHDTPVGDVAVIPNNRMVAAGKVRVILGEVEV